MNFGIKRVYECNSCGVWLHDAYRVNECNPVVLGRITPIGLMSVICGVWLHDAYQVKECNPVVLGSITPIGFMSVIPVGFRSIC